MSHLTVAFSGLTAYQDRFHEPFPTELQLPVAREELVALYDEQGEDFVINRIIELSGYQFPLIWTIIADLAPVHYHGGDLRDALAGGHLYLCAHEAYDEF
jgi:hypothetical protein